MAGKNTKSPIRIKVRKSSMLVKVALLAVLILSAAALLMISVELRRTEAKTDALRKQAAALEQSNSKLCRDIADLGTVDGIIRIAEEKLGLVEPGSIIFDPVND